MQKMPEPSHTSMLYEDVMQEIEVLEAKLQQEKASLAGSKEKYHQAESCLQNWQGKFDPVADDCTAEFCDCEDSTFFMRPIGVVEQLEDGRYSVCMAEELREGLCGIETWGKVWIIGASERDPLTVSKDPALMSFPRECFDYSLPYNNHVHVARHMIKTQESLSGLDPYTLAFTRELSAIMEDGAACHIGLQLTMVLCDVVSANVEAGRVIVAATDPSFQLFERFQLLDIKVYHPFVESVTNITRSD